MKALALFVLISLVGDLFLFSAPVLAQSCEYYNDLRVTIDASAVCTGGTALGQPTQCGGFVQCSGSSSGRVVLCSPSPSGSRLLCPAADTCFNQTQEAIDITADYGRTSPPALFTAEELDIITDRNRPIQLRCGGFSVCGN
jgi:hypothetical protein